MSNQNQARSIFAGVTSVVVKNTGEKAPFITKPGRFDARVVDARSGYSENPKRAGQPYIGMTIEVTAVHDGDYRAGERLSIWKSLQGEYNLRDVRSIGGAVLQCDPNIVTPEALEELFFAPSSGGLPAIVGMGLNCNVVPNRNGATDGEGNLYVNTYFNPLATGTHDAGF